MQAKFKSLHKCLSKYQVTQGATLTPEGSGAVVRAKPQDEGKAMPSDNSKQNPVRTWEGTNWNFFQFTGNPKPASWEEQDL